MILPNMCDKIAELRNLYKCDASLPNLYNLYLINAHESFVPWLKNQLYQLGLVKNSCSVYFVFHSNLKRKVLFPTPFSLIISRSVLDISYKITCSVFNFHCLMNSFRMVFQKRNIVRGTLPRLLSSFTK